MLPAPALLMTTFWYGLVEPTSWLPKVKVVDAGSASEPAPVPVSMIDCGELPALSIRDRVTCCGPLVVGAKTIRIAQPLVGANVAPAQLSLKIENPGGFAGDSSDNGKIRLAVPSLKIVIVWNGPVFPISTLPKATGLALMNTTGAVPVPESAIGCVPALPVRLRVTCCSPVTVGEKEIAIAQLALGATA